MAGVVEHLVAGAKLHDVARIHDGDAVGHVGHHAKVMGDVDGGEVILFLHGLDQLQNLRLNGHVQSGGRLVADEDLRPAGDGDGDDHPLAHTAGKFVGILLVAPLGVVNAHVAQHFQHGLVGILAFQTLMQLHGLLNLLADGFQRVQGGHGVLKHHGNLFAPDFQPVLVGLEFG